MTAQTTENDVDTHDPAGYAAWLRERAQANRDVAILPREQWPYRPAVLQHWAFRFEQGAELIEQLSARARWLEGWKDACEDTIKRETTKRLQAEHERDCAVEEVTRLQRQRDEDVNRMERAAEMIERLNAECNQLAGLRVDVAGDSNG